MSTNSSDKYDRRKVLTLGAAIAPATAAFAHDGLLGESSRTYRGSLPWQEGETDAPRTETTGTYLTEAEMAFVTAAANRIIPADPTGPSAGEAGVPEFIDRQLAGNYGQGHHFYLGGPWAKGTPSQGYQSRFTPAQFYRHAIAAIEQHVRQSLGGKSFGGVSYDVQDKLLKEMEAGQFDLPDGLDAKAFFTMFLQNVKEGYFSDPIYGGNRNGSAWAMIGFPGAHYDYSPWVTAYNKPVPVKPVGLLGRLDWTGA